MKKNTENLIQIGGEAVCIKSDMSLPSNVIDTLSHVIEAMFRHAGTALGRHLLKGKVIRLNGSDMASIQTRFQYNEDEHGFVFYVWIHLHKAMRMVGHHLVCITNDLVKATFVLKPVVGLAA
jgi:hypothetical protein